MIHDINGIKWSISSLTIFIHQEKWEKKIELLDILKKWTFHVLNTHEKKNCRCDPIIINKMEKLLQILVCLWCLWPFRWELYNTLWLGLCVSSSYQHLCILLYLLSISRFSTTGQWTWIMKYSLHNVFFHSSHTIFYFTLYNKWMFHCTIDLTLYNK